MTLTTGVLVFVAFVGVSTAAVLEGRNLTVSNAHDLLPQNASTYLSPLPQHIVRRPSERQVDEEIPQPAPRRSTSKVSFPYERLQLAQDRLDDQQPGYWNDMYAGCGSTKNCFGWPPGCEEKEACRVLSTVTVINGTFYFQMRASDANYVAMGLAPSAKMSSSSVMECVVEGNAVKAYMSWNVEDDTSNERLPLGNEQRAIELKQFKLMDGGLFCEITRVNRTTIRNRRFNLNEEPYHILLAAGNAVQVDGVRYHKERRIGSAEARMLDAYGTFEPASSWPLRLHGALMVLAWLFSATVGTMAARYFKGVWGKEMLCGKALWFSWHRILMLLTVGLHGVGIITIFAYIGNWSNSAGLHGILGAVTTGIAFLQAFGGFLRPSPDHPRRPIFNWMHRGSGFLAHTLAVITLFLSVELVASGLPMYLYYLLSGWVIFYVFMHALHTLTEIKSYYFLIIVFGSAIFTIAVLAIVIVTPL